MKHAKKQSHSVTFDTDNYYANMTNKSQWNNTSWRHKLLTPKKNRSNKSWLNQTPAPLLKEFDASALLLLPIDIPLSLSYSILRNVTLSLEFLESQQRNMFRVLPAEANNNISTSIQTDHAIASFVDLVLNGQEITNIDLLTSFNLNDAIPRGLRKCLESCEAIIPTALEEILLSISDCRANDVEVTIERFISNNQWNGHVIGILLCTTILEHSCKAMEELDHQPFLQYDRHRFNQLASEVGRLLCNCGCTRDGHDQVPFFAFSVPFSKERRRRRAMKKILRHLQSSKSLMQMEAETKVIDLPPPNINSPNPSTSPAQNIEMENKELGGEGRAYVRKVLFLEDCDEKARHEAMEDKGTLSMDDISVLVDLKDHGHFVNLDDIDQEWNAECSLLIRNRSRIDAAKAALQECDGMFSH